jgi:hypothetical protein
LADNLKARVLGSDGAYDCIQLAKSARHVSAQEHLMSLARGGVNGSGKAKDLAPRVAYTKGAEGAAPAEPAVPAEDAQDSLNATV